MARGVGDDEFPPVRGEIAIGHIDGDALFALRRKAIHQECEVKGTVLRSEFAAVGVKGGKLVIKDQF